MFETRVFSCKKGNKYKYNKLQCCKKTKLFEYNLLISQSTENANKMSYDFFQS